MVSLGTGLMSLAHSGAPNSGSQESVGANALKLTSAASSDPLCFGTGKIQGGGGGGVKSTKSSVIESAVKERHVLQIRHNPLSAEHVEQEWWF